MYKLTSSLTSLFSFIFRQTTTTTTTTTPTPTTTATTTTATAATTVVVRPTTGSAVSSVGNRRFVFQKKLVKIRPLPMGTNTRMKVGRVTTTTPMEQVYVKEEPLELPAAEEFEEVAIDGTELQNTSPRKESVVVYVCKPCRVYFPLPRLLDEHNETVHKAGTQSPPEKKVEVSTVQYNGYGMTKLGVFHCDYCPFTSKVRSTISSHVRRKHADLLHEGGAPGNEQKPALASPSEPSFDISDVDEVDDEELWPVEVLEDDNPETNEPEVNPSDPNEKLRTCPYCPFRTTKNSTYHSHVKRRHRENWLKTIAQKVAALKPEPDAEPGVEFKCQHCPFRAEKRSDINSHVLLNHKSNKELTVSRKRKREPKTEAPEPTETANDEEVEDQKDVLLAEEEGKEAQKVNLCKCTFCPFETPSKNALRMHINRRHRSADARRRTRESGIKRQPKALFCTGYACHYCTFISATVASMRAHTHREQHPQPQPVTEIPVTEYDCHQCYYKARSRKSMQLHLKRCHTTQPNSEGMYVCNVCSYETLSHMGLQRHVSIKHNKPKRDPTAKPEIFVCQDCDYQCLNEKLMEWHRRQHEPPSTEFGGEKDGRDYFCNDCDFSTWTKGQLYSHIMRNHRAGDGAAEGTEFDGHEQIFVCSHCDYTSKNKHLMKVHVIRRHTEDYNHECDICGKKYKIRADLTNHIRFQHREQPIICDVCGKTCRNSNLLYLHQKFAHYKPDFECHICRRRMVSQANLDEHILKQHEQREDVVCEECGKSFTRATRLKIHMRIHTGVKPYSCKVCFKAFARRNGLRQHLLIHTGQRPYLCDICGKSFTQKTGLISHRKSHPGSHPPLPRVTIDHVLSDLLADEA